MHVLSKGNYHELNDLKLLRLRAELNRGISAIEGVPLLTSWPMSCPS